MQQNLSFAFLTFGVIVAVGAAIAYLQYRVGANLEAGVIVGAAFILAALVASAIQVADQLKSARCSKKLLISAPNPGGLMSFPWR